MTGSDRTTHWSLRLAAALRSGSIFGAAFAVYTLLYQGCHVLTGAARPSSLFAVPVAFFLLGGLAFLIHYFGGGGRSSERLEVSAWSAVILIGAATVSWIAFIVRSSDPSLPFTPGQAALLAAASWTVVIVAFRALWWAIRGRRA